MYNFEVLQKINNKFIKDGLKIISKYNNSLHQANKFILCYNNIIYNISLINQTQFIKINHKKTQNNLQIKKILSKKQHVSFNMNDPLKCYMKNIYNIPLLNADEEFYYAELSKNDLNARNNMIQSNLRLVIKSAKFYVNRGIPFLDLISEGNLGLIYAIKKFDPQKGYRFSTYAVWWIKEYIERLITNQSRMVRLPVYLVKELSRYLHIKKKLFIQLNRNPTINEIAFKANVDSKRVKKILNCNNALISLNDNINSNSKKTLLESLSDCKTNNPAVNCIQEDIIESLYEWLDKLNNTQKTIIERRYGLGEYKTPQTLDVISNEINLTREKIRIIQIMALKKLRNVFEKNKLSLVTIDSQEM